MKFLATVFSILFSGILFSQSDISFLNKYLEECSKKEALYKRDYVEIEEGIYKSEIRYFNGTIRATGTYVLIEDEMVPHGDFIFYYENGQKESEGRFVEGYKSGEWRRYMKDGTELKPKLYKSSFGNTVDPFR